MAAVIRNLTILVEHTGQRIHVAEVETWITATELLNALARRINLPAGTKGVLIRKTTHQQLISEQSLDAARIEDGETLIADFERYAGGSIEFYADGRLSLNFAL